MDSSMLWEGMMLLLQTHVLPDLTVLKGKCIGWCCSDMSVEFFC